MIIQFFLVYLSLKGRLRFHIDLLTYRNDISKDEFAFNCWLILHDLGKDLPKNVISLKCKNLSSFFSNRNPLELVYVKIHLILVKHFLKNNKAFEFKNIALKNDKKTLAATSQ